MHPPTRSTLGIAAVLLAAASLSPAVAPLRAQAAAAAQAGGPTACALLDAAELMRITGRKDVLKSGPVPSEPGDTPKGITECEFLGFSFSLTAGMTREWFERARADQVKNGTKTQPVSGVGEDGYYWWDPRPGSYRQVGIALRKGTDRLVIMDLAPSDSIEALKPVLLSVAKSAAAKMR